MDDFRLENKTKRILVLIVAFIATPLTGAGIDIYVPALPEITRVFHIPASLAQISLSLYLIGYGLFQPITGPIADRYGRKPLLLTSSLLIFIFSLLAAMATNINLLLVARFLQGVAMAGFGVVVRALLPDIYCGKTLQKMMPLLTTSWACGPILAPYIGAHLQIIFSWRACFYFLSGYAALIFLLAIKIPETIHDRHYITSKTLKTNYLTIIKSRLFWGLITMSILLYAFLIVFAVIGPFLIEKVLAHSATFYGVVALLMGVIWFIGSIISRLTAHQKISKLLFVVTTIATIVSFISVIYSFLSPLSVMNIVAPTLVLLLFAAVIFTFSYSGSLTLFPKIAGVNSAVAGTLLSLGVGIISALSALLKTDHDSFLFVLFFIFFLTTTIIFNLVTKKPLIETE